jgi:hypothetical protein
LSAPITASPLTWPTGWPRTEHDDRRYGKFGKREASNGSAWRQLKDVTIADGAGRVMAELDRMGARDVVVSTNLQLRRDGLPRSDQREPSDSGVAVYWTDKAWNDRCIAIDRYVKVADNLAAIAATLDAMRAIERHGGAEILSRAFTGFTALPSSAESWWGVLGVEPNARRVEIDAAYRRQRSVTHPDKGGNGEDFDAVQRAYEQACRAAP